MNPQDFYRLIFSDILLGYTSTSHSFFGPIFIKHLSYLDMGALDSQYNLYLLKAKSNGILDYKTREIDIIKENLWTQKEERELLDFEKFVTDVKINISKDYLNSRRQRMKKDINDVEKKIDKLKRKKEYYIGQTAESIAHKKLTYSKIIQSYYKDEKLLEKLIDEETNKIALKYSEVAYALGNVMDIGSRMTLQNGSISDLIEKYKLDVAKIGFEIEYIPYKK